MGTSAVYTEGDICRKCYSCGYCVNMCSQHAKRIYSRVPAVIERLDHRAEHPLCAMMAPSFPAAFLDIARGSIVGVLREAGFDGAYEVAFGADLVSYEYDHRFRELMQTDDAEDPCDFFISSPCRAIVGYVEKTHPELVPHLAGVMSPMEVMGQVLDNILKNAAEFTPEEHLPKILSPFFTKKPVGKGTQVGLPVCYGIVKMHGGAILAGNNDGGAACFEIKHRAREEHLASYIYP